ncbi:MAG TPA: YncE family protein [Gemmatimonadaceae bacterium]|nr:YncE family protein [Gemmatimonadaceae bacterium]
MHLRHPLSYLIGVASLVAVSAPPVLRTVADIPMPGPAVRFDYQSLDTATNRLFMSHMNAGQLVVFDVKTRTVVRALDGFERVRGVLAVPEEGRVYASAWGRHQVVVVDATSLAVMARVDGVSDPDGLAYAPGPRRVFVSNEQGNADDVIDAHTNQFVTELKLDGEAGNTVYDPVSRHILVGVHGKNELVTIDPGSATILAHTPLPGIDDPHGIVLDTKRHLAFVAGEGNAMLAVVDLSAMRIVHTYKVPDGPDVLAYDPGWRRLYVSSESGGVAVFTEADSPAGVGLVRNGELSMPRAHTVSVDPRTHLVYFPLENVNGKPLLRIMQGDPPAP